jgi:Cation efflux family
MALPSLNVSMDEGTGDNSNPKAEGKNDAHDHTETEEEEDKVLELPSSSSTSSLTKTLSQMTAAEKREHSRRHSRIHSRNLSVFFPQPGSEAEREADQIQAANTFQKPVVHLDTDVLSSSSKLTPADSANSLSPSPSKSRKGHHRKHSVMHDAEFVSQSNQPHFHSHQENEEDHKHSVNAYAQHKRQSSSLLGQLLSTPVWNLLSNTALPPAHRPILIFGTFHFVLGAILWMKGQSGDSLAMTGLGYLVVFDAFGVLNSVASEWLIEQWRREKASVHAHGHSKKFAKPYGPHRIETLLQFSQTIYLLFAAIYVCKESVEHALLEGHEEEHHEQDEIGLHLPQVTLLITTAACIFSNMVLQNHVKLVAACGFSTAASEATSANRRRGGHGRQASVLADPSVMAGPFLQLFANPFSVTVLFFACTLTISAFAMPDFQVAALDKVLAGLESVAMLYVAYPASKALGKILLQTAPKQHEVQNVQLMRTLRTIEEHKLVTYVAPPHLWQLTPPTSAINQTQPVSAVHFSANGLSSSSSASSLLLGQATNRTAKNAALIASVQIFLHDNASDADVLDITRWAWQLLAPAVGAGAGLPVGESLRGALRAGEVIVQVCREKERLKYREAHQNDHQHEHDHSHDHHTGHDHHHHHHDQKHEHKHIHGHSHTHETHDHDHKHDSHKDNHHHHNHASHQAHHHNGHAQHDHSHHHHH